MCNPSESDSLVTAMHLAREEIRERTWGITRQFLQSNVVATNSSGEAVIARVDTSSEHGAFVIYFPVVDESYFIVIYIRPDEAGLLAFSHVNWEAQTSAQLLISSETLTTDEITRTIDLVPSSTRARDPKAKGHFQRRESMWVLELQADLPGTVESKLTALLQAVASKARAIRSLGDSCDICVQLQYNAWIGNGHVRGLNVKPNDLALIGSLGATLDFNVHASGPWLIGDDDDD